MTRKINIAIDGYSSCGKSTLARSIAKELNYVYVDSGAMYRAITLYALKNGLIKGNSVDVSGLVSQLENIYIAFKYNIDTQQSETYLNGTNVEKEIRSIAVSNHVSQVSEIKEVRAKLVRLQRRMTEGKGVVMDGRDIGTVVIPDAELKLFMVADPEIRSQRRFNELRTKGLNTSFEEVMHNVVERDRIDTGRKHDPLKQAADAVVVDNSDLTIEEQFLFTMTQVNRAIEKLEKSIPLPS